MKAKMLVACAAIVAACAIPAIAEFQVYPGASATKSSNGWRTATRVTKAP